MNMKYDYEFRAATLSLLDEMSDRDAAHIAGISLSTLHEFKAKAGLVKAYVRKPRREPDFVLKARATCLQDLIRLSRISEEQAREIEVMLDGRTVKSIRPLLARTLDRFGVPRHRIREMLG